jgi:hypothetical protein
VIVAVSSQSCDCMTYMMIVCWRETMRWFLSDRGRGQWKIQIRDQILTFCREQASGPNNEYINIYSMMKRTDLSYRNLTRHPDYRTMSPPSFTDEVAGTTLSTSRTGSLTA